MAKEIEIPQGNYCVGVDFPNGSYVFDTKGVDATVGGYFKSSEGGKDYLTYELNEKAGYQLHLNLQDGDKFDIDNKMTVIKAEAINFD